MITIGQRIKNLRTDLKYTQEQLAELIDKTKSNVSGYENDKFEPSAQTIIALCKVFNISSDYLLFGTTNDTLKLEQKNTISFTESEIDLLKKIVALNRDEKMRIEGIIDGILIAKDLQVDKKAKSSNLISGEEAATDETA